MSRSAVFVGAPVVVGHRGAPVAAPENTVESFRQAAAGGASWVELDARRCADGIIVHHDAWAGDGAALVDRSAAALAELGIVTLEQALAGMPDGLGADVEIKNFPGEPDYDEASAVASEVAELLAGAGRPVLVTSFNPGVLATVEGRGLPRGLLTTQWLRFAAGVELAQELGVEVLCAHVDAPELDEDQASGTIAATHAAGLEVMVWTVDDLDQAVRLASAGVDALCTNDPAGVATALKGRELRRPR